MAYAYKENNGLPQAFEIPYPYDEVRAIPYTNLEDHFGEKAILERYASEFDTLEIEANSPQVKSFLTEKRAAFVETTYTGALQCIRKLSMDKSFYFLKYKNGRKQLIRGLQYMEDDGDLLSAINAIKFHDTDMWFPFCNDTHKHFRKSDPVAQERNCLLYEDTSTFRIEFLDRIILDHYLDGSNHIVIGVGSNRLYYDALQMGAKTQEFKTSYPIHLTQSIDYPHLLVTQEATYALQPNK